VGGTGGVHSVPLFAHWNGLAWTLQTLSSGVIPASVSMVSSTDGWAAGNLAGSGGGTASDAALYHYDGVAWAPVSFPLPPGTGSGHLASIRALASDNAWAVGNWLPSGGGGPLPLVEHWDGTAWNLVSFPVPTGANIDLQTIDGVAGDLWVGGARRSGGSQVAFEAHGDGTTWSDVSAGLPGVFVQSTVRTSAADVWVSGYTQSPYMSGVPPRWPSVSAHWNGTSWTSYPPSDSNVDLPFTGILSFGATNAWLAVSGSNTEPGVTEHFSCPSAPGQPLPGANAPSGPTVVSGSAGAGANSPALPRAGAHTLRSTPMNLAGSFALALTVILALTAAVRLRSRHRS
jgi:hypothetical protein